jgi:phosphoribosylanthranilate isomerase
MHVKICGITRTEDALLAADLGATAVGFVLWPGSPRAIDPFRARAIVRHLPPLVSVVGVFVDQPVEYVKRVTRLVPLDAVQLHGGESADYCLDAGARVIKAVAASRAAAAAMDRWPRNVVILLDACDCAQHGGAGRAIDWTVAADIARLRPTILAGGLCAANVAEAVRRVRPFGVDVSSGVEARPGIKDPVRLRAFFEALRDGGERPGSAGTVPALPRARRG